MKIIKIQLDYLFGPIWKNCFDPITKIIHTGVKVVDDDEVVWRLDKEIQDLYASYYEFDSHEMPCWFNKEKEKADKEVMLLLLEKLIKRLDEINDGSFEIEDLETERVKNL